jgi:membrane protein
VSDASAATARSDIADRAEPDVSERERSLGRHADRPGEIPARGWWSVLRRVWREAGSDNVSMSAASCGFFALLAIFPALSVLISLYGLVFDPVSVERQLEGVRDFVPPTAFEMIATRVHDLVTTTNSKLGWSLAFSVALALWSSSAATKAMMTALNVSYEETEKRGFITFNLVALVLTLCGILGMSLALSIIVGVPAVLQLAWLGPLGAVVLRLVSWALLAGFLMLGLAVLYRWGPSRERARWHWITPGSILVAVVWIAVSVLFSFYVANFSSYDVTYGSLGAVVAAMMWLYISAFVVLIGAELNAELELQTARDTTSGPPRPMGERGAFVADHVANES